MFQNGAFTGNSSLKIRGNFAESSTSVSSAAVRLTGSGSQAGSVNASSSNIAESLLDIGVECASGSYTPQTIVFGSTSNTITGSYGALNFGLAGSPTGVTGHVGFRVLPTGSEVMVTWAIDIASGTKMTSGETIVTAATRFAYTDNKVIPGNNQGGGLSGNAYAPAFFTAAGLFQYAGPTYTTSGTSWWYGQGVYTLRTG